MKYAHLFDSPRGSVCIRRTLHPKLHFLFFFCTNPPSPSTFDLFYTAKGKSTLEPGYFSGVSITIFVQLMDKSASFQAQLPTRCEVQRHKDPWISYVCDPSICGLSFRWKLKTLVLRLHTKNFNLPLPLKPEKNCNIFSTVFCTLHTQTCQKYCSWL